MARHRVEKINQKNLLLKCSLAAICAIFILNGCTNEANTEAPRPPYVDKINGTLKNSTSHLDQNNQIETVKLDEGAPVMLNNSAEPHEIATIPVGDFQPPVEINIPVAKPSANPKNMFGKSLRSDDERMDRLERVVQDMRNEFNSMKPSVQRLTAIEGELQRIIAELKEVNQTPSMRTTNNIAQRQRAPVAKSMTRPQIVNSNADSFEPIPVITSQKQVTSSQASSNKSFGSSAPSGVSGVFDVRVGEHSGRTRLVLDTGAKQSFTTDIDNDENIMIVELPNSTWNTSTSKNLGGKGYLKSYKVEQNGEGQMVIFQLNKNAVISSKTNIPAVSGSGHRIVIDLVSP
jgi:hypothetical protein